MLFEVSLVLFCSDVPFIWLVASSVVFCVEEANSVVSFGVADSVVGILDMVSVVSSATDSLLLTSADPTFVSVEVVFSAASDVCAAAFVSSVVSA